jgi:hypothetical protein
LATSGAETTVEAVTVKFERPVMKEAEALRDNQSRQNGARLSSSNGFGLLKEASCCWFEASHSEGVCKNSIES